MSVERAEYSGEPFQQYPRQWWFAYQCMDILSVVSPGSRLQRQASSDSTVRVVNLWSRSHYSNNFMIMSSRESRPYMRLL